MPDPADAADVAKKLTPAQRDAFKRGTEIGVFAMNKQQADALSSKGLAERLKHSRRMMDWTPLGKAVRAHLQEEGGA